MRGIAKGFWTCLGGLFLTQRAFAVDVGEAFPNLQSKNLEAGTPEALMSPGKVTLVNFWATWCEACKVELAEMEEEFKPLLSHAGFKVTFVSLDKDPAKAGQWFKTNLKNGDALAKFLLSDPEFKVADQLSVDAFPMTFVIDQEGKVRHIQRGFKPELKQTAELVKVTQHLLEKK